MIFGRRNASPQPQRAERSIDTPPPVPKRSADRPIIVPQSAVDAADPHALVQAVVDFVNFALHTASFNRDEIAPNAVRAFHADNYMAQVSNGGHGQYAHNSQMLGIILSDAQEGLEAMRHPAAALHQRFVKFSQDFPARFRRVMEGGGFGDVDSQIEALDKDFFALGNTRSITVASRDWLKALPELKPVPDAELRMALGTYALSNPQAALRSYMREDKALDSHANDPILQALMYLCVKAEPSRMFVAIVAGVPGVNLGDGIKVMRFVVETDKGRCSAFFHPKVSLLFDDSAKDQPPIVKLPTEWPVRYAMERTGKNLFDALPR